MQQHLHAEVDDQSGKDLAQQQGDDADVFIVDQEPQQQAQAYTAGQRNDIQHHGTQPAEHDGVAGGLAVAETVEQVRGGHQHHRCHRVDQQRCPRIGGQPAYKVAVIQRHFPVIVNDAEHADRGGQPIQPRRPAGAAHAPVKHIGHGAEQQVKRGKQEVDAGIDDRHGQQPAGDHGAQGSQRKEEQAAQLRHRHPLQRAPQVNGAETRLHQQGNGAHRHMDQREDLHAHEEVGIELAAAGDGQRMHQPHAAAVHQIGEQGHGQQHAKKRGDDGRRGGTAAEIVADIFQRGISVCVIIGPAALAPQAQRQGAQPHGGIAEKQRPEAAPVGPHQGPVRGQCHGLHSQHLPARK